MSTYEKIATIILGILVLAMLVFSYHEFKEPASPEIFSADSFDTSVGQTLTIGAYATLVSQKSSGGLENNCAKLQPVIIAVLHDIKERLEHVPSASSTDAFEVNLSTLQLLCNKNAEVVLADSVGNQLLLTKAPFARTIPPEGTAADIGTEVRINATLFQKGLPTPAAPTTYGDILILDRFLNEATTSPL